MENISALIDGELSESELAELESHLSTCENCSAIHELYKEMSHGIGESCEDPPESLCANVMDAIRAQDKQAVSDGTPPIEDKKKSKSKPIVYLRRYLPAVACLAIILMAIPFVMNDRVRNNENDFASAPAAAPVALEAAFDGYVAPDAAMAEIEESMVEAFEFDAPMEAGGGAMREGEAGEEDVMMGANAQAAPVMGAAPIPEDEYGFNLDEAYPDSRGNLIAPHDEDDVYTRDSRWYSQQDAENHIDGLRALNELISEAYAVIEIIGVELPDIIAGHESLLLGDWTVLNSVFRIPRSLAQEMILEFENYDGISITITDPDSEFAVVLYSR